MYNGILLKAIEETESGAKLKELLDIYFLYQSEKYVSEFPEQYELNLYGNELEIYTCETIKDISEITSSYFEVSKAFRDDYKLNHPRKFIKFTMN
ncbi:hypothetical protein EYB33_12335 [Lysinibacillus sphaericus]|uniref:hypothetical protein n=1 Tax=Lysinibacillus sphaericus TaxID=1421 RepID=UPI001E3CF734|nr:hypothetical protein [Lysinibacillus sphaericus]UDK94941.1 hypothetical protein EYB33_12335 [Lysinibacillus sphaericus]